MKVTDRMLCFCLSLLFLGALFVGCDNARERNRENELSVYINDVGFSVGDDADSVTSRLGHANYYSCVSSCAGEGEDELYIYNGFKIIAHRTDRGSEIVSIELTNDLLSTKEGVSIGDSAKTVSEKYGEGRAFSGGVEYKDEGCVLRFFIRDGRVKAIKYLKNGI